MLLQFYGQNSPDIDCHACCDNHLDQQQYAGQRLTSDNAGQRLVREEPRIKYQFSYLPWF